MDIEKNPDPIDSVAKRITLPGNTVRHDYRIKSRKGRYLSFSPPKKMRARMSGRLQKKGIKIGDRKFRLVVVGRCSLNGGEKCRVVVRCDCGRYEVPTDGQWKTGGCEGWECYVCYRERQMRRIHKRPYRYC